MKGRPSKAVIEKPGTSKPANKPLATPRSRQASKAGTSILKPVERQESLALVETSKYDSSTQDHIISLEECCER